MDEVRKAVDMVRPCVVIAPEGDTFETTTMSAHVMRNDTVCHPGIIVPGKHAQLQTRIKWAHDRGFGPIILRPPNFHGAQDKELWQMHQHGVWQSSG